MTGENQDELERTRELRQAQVQDMAAEFESLLSRLYSRYAELFAEDSQLWTALARDEQDHALALRSLEGADIVGNGISTGADVSAERLQPVVMHLEQLIERAQRGDTSRGRALAAAVGMETDMLEGSVGAVLNPANPAAATVQQYLTSETRRHLSVLLDRIREVQKLSANATRLPAPAAVQTPPEPRPARPPVRPIRK